MRRNIGRDPFELAARYCTTCACGMAILKGDRVLYYPQTRTVVCSQCAVKASAEISEARILEGC